MFITLDDVAKHKLSTKREIGIFPENYKIWVCGSDRGATSTGAKIPHDALYETVKKGNATIVSLLLKFKTNLSEAPFEDSEKTPLIHIAAMSCDQIMAQTLLTEGNENINITGGSLWSALYACVKSSKDIEDKTSMIKFLIDHGANAEDVSGYRGSVLHLASLISPSLVDSMMKSFGERVSVDLPDREGKLPAHYAAIGGNSSIFDQILLPGLSSKDFQGRLPIHLAAAAGSIKAMNFIILNSPLKQAELYETDADDWNPLHWACRQKDSLVVKWILENARSDTKDIIDLCVARSKENWMPLDVATRHNNERFIDVIQQRMENLTVEESGIDSSRTRPIEVWARTSATCDSCFCVSSPLKSTFHISDLFTVHLQNAAKMFNLL